MEDPGGILLVLYVYHQNILPMNKTVLSHWLETDQQEYYLVFWRECHVM